MMVLHSLPTAPSHLLAKGRPRLARNPNPVFGRWGRLTVVLLEAGQTSNYRQQRYVERPNASADRRITKRSHSRVSGALRDKRSLGVRLRTFFGGPGHGSLHSSLGNIVCPVLGRPCSRSVVFYHDTCVLTLPPWPTEVRGTSGRLGTPGGTLFLSCRIRVRWSVQVHIFNPSWDGLRPWQHLLASLPLMIECCYSAGAML